MHLKMDMKCLVILTYTVHMDSHRHFILHIPMYLLPTHKKEFGHSD